MSMTVTSVLGEALTSMAATKMRSFLTMLGIIIGVAADVLMLAIGQGVQNKIQDSIDSMGSNILIVLSGAAPSGGVRMGFGNAPTLTGTDAREIATLPGIVGTGPAFAGTAQVVYGTNNWSTQILGVGERYLDIREWAIVNGTAFVDSDYKSAARMALIGQTVVQNLFGEDEDPVGKTIRIKNIPFTVIGVLDRKGQTLDGRDQDDAVIIPLATAQRKVFGTPFPDSVRVIIVKATDAAALERAEDDIAVLLRQRHRIAPNAEDDFNIRNLTAVAETAASMGKMMSILLGSIASISLVVGGIGIMNIMLVSVTERTREIGIRLAIGAYQSDILMQFLLEAALISLAGGLIGVILGVGGAALVEVVAPVTAEVSASSIILAFAVAAGIGIFFGFYPARKAAALNPIDALRFQ